MTCLVLACGDASEANDGGESPGGANLDRQQEGSSARPGQTPSPSANSKPPIILISIDTLRSDRLPAYGYEAGKTPAIDRLARDGTLFQRAYAHTPLTLPSHVSVLTGLLPDAHGIRDNQGYRFDSDSVPFLPRRLQQIGYRTGAAVSAYVLNRTTGLGEEGFDLYEDRIGVAEGLALGAVARPGGESLRAIQPWLDSVAGEPFFLFLHLFEPHAPYTPPEPFASRFDDAYDGEIAAADHVVGELLRRLEELGVYDSALVALFSDHGEGLGDHGEEEHGIFLYREALQIPLILKLPGQEMAGSVATASAQLVDLYPTVLALLGLQQEGDLPGMDLRRLLEEDAPERQIYAETFYPRLHYGWSDLASLIEGRWHYIEGNYGDGPGGELYDLAADPEETNDLRASERRQATALAEELGRFDGEFQAPSAVDSEARAKLAALGYLGTANTSASGALPDPRRQLPTLVPLKQAFELAREGEHEAAVEAFRQALGDNPGMPEAWEYLGLSLHRLDRGEEALEAYGQALALSGGDPQLVASMALIHLELDQLDLARAGIEAAREGGVELDGVARRLGLGLARSGRWQEAQSVLQAALGRGESGVASALGRVLSEEGRQDAAVETLRRALRSNPADPEALETLSLVYLRLQSWEEAATAAERALDLDAGRVQAWNNRGVALHYLGRKAQALEAWQQAMALDPEQWDILFNLGTRAAEAGRLELALHSLRRFAADAPAERYPAELEQARAFVRRFGS